MNAGSVITNEKTKQKIGHVFEDEKIMPRFSILNPRFTMTLPHYQMTAGIYDIFNHIFEQYFSDTDDNTSGTVSYLRSPEQNLRFGRKSGDFSFCIKFNSRYSQAFPAYIDSCILITVHLISAGAAIDTFFQFQFLFEFSAAAADFVRDCVDTKQSRS